MKIPKKEYFSVFGSETLYPQFFYLHTCNLVLAFESTSILDNSANQIMTIVKFSVQ